MKAYLRRLYIIGCASSAPGSTSTGAATATWRTRTRASSAGRSTSTRAGARENRPRARRCASVTRAPGGGRSRAAPTSGGAAASTGSRRRRAWPCAGLGPGTSSSSLRGSGTTCRATTAAAPASPCPSTWARRCCGAVARSAWRYPAWPRCGARGPWPRPRPSPAPSCRWSRPAPRKWARRCRRRQRRRTGRWTLRFRGRGEGGRRGHSPRRSRPPTGPRCGSSRGS